MLNKNPHIHTVISSMDPPTSLQDDAILSDFAIRVRSIVINGVEQSYERYHVMFRFKDIRGRKNTSPDAPDEDDIDNIVNILQGIVDKNGHMSGGILIHCQAGVSRSTAISYMLVRLAFPELAPHRCREYVKSLRSISRPNERMVHLFERRQIHVARTK